MTPLSRSPHSHPSRPNTCLACLTSLSVFSSPAVRSLTDAVASSRPAFSTWLRATSGSWLNPSTTCRTTYITRTRKWPATGWSRVVNERGRRRGRGKGRGRGSAWELRSAWLRQFNSPIDQHAASTPSNKHVGLTGERELRKSRSAKTSEDERRRVKQASEASEASKRGARSPSDTNPNYYYGNEP